MSFCEGLKKIFKNGNYLLLCGSLTSLYYILTGIQYWGSDYLIQHINAPKNDVFIAFGLVSITGPVLGVVVGGNITTCFGGYNSKKVLTATSIVSILCLMVSVPVPFCVTFY